jgi:Zinc finger, C3HC4 type (RING finger)
MSENLENNMQQAPSYNEQIDTPIESPRSPNACLHNIISNTSMVIIPDEKADCSDGASSSGSNKTECSICLSTFKDNRIELECHEKHSLHDACLASWLIACSEKQQKPSCPVCRQELKNYEDIDINDLRNKFGNIIQRRDPSHSLPISELSRLILPQGYNNNNGNNQVGNNYYCECNMKWVGFILCLVIVAITYMVYLITGK